MLAFAALLTAHLRGDSAAPNAMRPPDPTRDAALSDDEARRLLAFQSALIEAIAHEGSEADAARAVCEEVERLVTDTFAYVMLADAAREELSMFAGGSVPQGLVERVDGLGPGLESGSCPAAFFTGEPAIAVDLASDPRWVKLQQLVHDFGLGACWSAPVRGPAGHPIGTFAIVSQRPRTPTPFDLALLERAAALVGLAVGRDRLGADLRLLDQVFSHSREGIVVVDPALRVRTSNPAMRALSGYDADDLVGRAIDDLAVPTAKDSAPPLSDELFQQGEARREQWLLHKGGHEVPAHVSFVAVRNQAGEVSHYVGFYAGLAEHKAAEAKIAYFAYHDAVTELPNRALVRLHAAQALALTERAGGHAAVLHLDVDSFRLINDSLGQAAGDALLKTIAGRIATCIRESDSLARLGGDEFVVVATGLTGAEGAAQVAERILERVGEPIELDGGPVHASLSIGVALSPDDGREFEGLLTKAEGATVAAKEAGKSTYRLHAERAGDDAASRLALRTALRRAVERGELSLHFQPQIDLSTGALFGVEALLRWKHPELGMVSPARFIPIAEESGLIVPIGEWVLREACIRTAELRRDLGRDLLCAVNLSAPQFRRGDLERSVRQALDGAGLEASALELELTESILLSDTTQLLDTVGRLRDLGVHLSIDDFGTGYSSFAYLKRFAVEKLKIDQSFVRGMDTSTNDAAIVRAIIQVAHSLGLKTVAEGVETARHRELLVAEHCDEAQGYHFARPMPVDALLAFVRAWDGGGPRSA